MPRSVRVLVACGAAMAGVGLGASAAASTPTPPTLVTAGFVCSNGICQVGPGNVGVGFSAALSVTGSGPAGDGGSTPEVTKVVSGRLPPGLRLTQPYGLFIMGNPTRAGTYSFTVQLAYRNTDTGQLVGPTGTQQLMITIATGGVDRLVLHSASLNDECGYEPVMNLWVSDANSGATYTVKETSTAKRIHTFTGITESALGVDVRFAVPAETLPSGGSITVTDTEGGSATIAVRKIGGC